MARSSSSSSTPGFAAAVKLSLPVAAGYLPLGIGYGMYTVAAGISWWWIIPMSLLVAVVCAVIGLAAGKDLMLIVALLSFTLVLPLRVNALQGGRFSCHFGGRTARRSDSSIGRSGHDLDHGGGSEPRLFPDRTDVGP